MVVPEKLLMKKIKKREKTKKQLVAGKSLPDQPHKLRAVEDGKFGRDYFFRGQYFNWYSLQLLLGHRKMLKRGNFRMTQTRRDTKRVSIEPICYFITFETLEMMTKGEFECSSYWILHYVHFAMLDELSYYNHEKIFYNF